MDNMHHFNGEMPQKPGDSSGGSGGDDSLIRTTVNNDFIFGGNTVNVDSNRFNSIGQTSSSSSDISGSNSEFHRRRYPNDFYKYDFELVKRNEPCGYASTVNQVKIPTHLRNCAIDGKVKVNRISNDGQIYNDRNKYSVANKQLWQLKNYNNGNTVM